MPLATFERVGAWALTEPGSGSDAFGSMRSTAVADGDDFVINGSKTFITNGPFADTIVFICRLVDGSEPAKRPIVSFVLDRGMDGLEQTRPLAKMGMHSSPTGEIFATDVRVTADRLLTRPNSGSSGGGGARSAAQATFASERASVAAMAKTEAETR